MLIGLFGSLITEALLAGYGFYSFIYLRIRHKSNKFVAGNIKSIDSIASVLISVISLAYLLTHLMLNSIFMPDPATLQHLEETNSLNIFTRDFWVIKMFWIQPVCYFLIGQIVLIKPVKEQFYIRLIIGLIYLSPIGQAALYSLFVVDHKTWVSNGLSLIGILFLGALVFMLLDAAIHYAIKLLLKLFKTVNEYHR